MKQNRKEIVMIEMSIDDLEMLIIDTLNGFYKHQLPKIEEMIESRFRHNFLICGPHVPNELRKKVIALRKGATPENSNKFQLAGSVRDGKQEYFIIGEYETEAEAKVALKLLKNYGSPFITFFIQRP